MFSWQLGGRLVLVRGRGCQTAEPPSRFCELFVVPPDAVWRPRQLKMSLFPKRSQPASEGKGSRGGHAHSALIATATNHLVPTSSPFPDDCVSPLDPNPRTALIEEGWG